jgi:hypothetical protein
MSFNFFAKNDRALTVLATVSMCLSLAAGLYSVFQFAYAVEGPESGKVLAAKLRREVDALASKQVVTDGAVEKLLTDHTAITQAVHAGGSEAALLVSLTDLQGRLKTLEKVILESPAKALDCHLLRMQVDAVKQEAKESEARSARDIERIYDLSKWLLGATALAVPAFATVFLVQAFGRRKKDETEED